MSITREIMWPVVSGIALTGICFALGIAGDLWLGWDWLAVTAIALACAAFGAAGLAVTGASHPPTWGGGFWSAYMEMSGREAAGGGLSEMTRPPSGWHVPLLVVAAPPAITLVAIIVVSLAS
jgi:hypothetical protein